MSKALDVLAWLCAGEAADAARDASSACRAVPPGDVCLQRAGLSAQCDAVRLSASHAPALPLRPPLQGPLSAQPAAAHSSAAALRGSFGLWLSADPPRGACTAPRLSIRAEALPLSPLRPLLSAHASASTSLSPCDADADADAGTDADSTSTSRATSVGLGMEDIVQRRNHDKIVRFSVMGTHAVADLEAEHQPHKQQQMQWMTPEMVRRSLRALGKGRTEECFTAPPHVVFRKGFTMESLRALVQHYAGVSAQDFLSRAAPLRMPRLLQTADLALLRSISDPDDTSVPRQTAQHVAEERLVLTLDMAATVIPPHEDAKQRALLAEREEEDKFFEELLPPSSPPPAHAQASGSLATALAYDDVQEQAEREMQIPLFPTAAKEHGSASGVDRLAAFCVLEQQGEQGIGESKRQVVAEADPGDLALLESALAAMPFVPTAADVRPVLTGVSAAANADMGQDQQQRAGATTEPERWARTNLLDERMYDALRPRMAIQYPFELDSFQKQAVMRLENHENVFVAAHTSAGKTVVAEYAVAMCARHKTRAVYTSPIKALSNQKFRDFRNKFDDVGLITGDVTVNPNASCLIMTTEILRSMLYRGADLVHDIEWIIFDEIHYVNDAERGVVYEEVIALVNESVGLVFLSATTPNALEFSEWVGRTQQRPVYVISTRYRPVPLEHWLFASGQLFKILDHRGTFQADAVNHATQAFLAKETKQIAHSQKPKNAGKGGRGGGGRAATTSGRGGGRGHRGGRGLGGGRRGPTGAPMGGASRFSATGSRQQWLSLVARLRKDKLLPVVVFSFSKKKCDQCADGLRGMDLLTQREKSTVRMLMTKARKRLSSGDMNLPQILRMHELLERGIGVHHGGLLPIMKEVVELLFSSGVVKVLFATETFAMGVNMPARCVVFNSLRKHDGKEHRDLQPGEYTQMAGRAGRRGLDTVGTCIIACWNDVPAVATLKKMMTGTAAKLASQFRLTYNMLLNLLRVEDLSVVDMIKRSFAEFHTQRALGSHDFPARLERCQRALDLAQAMADAEPCIRPASHNNDNSDEGDPQKDIEEFFALAHAAQDQLANGLAHAAETVPRGVLTQFVGPGRVVMVGTTQLAPTPALVLSAPLPREQIHAAMERHHRMVHDARLLSGAVQPRSRSSVVPRPAGTAAAAATGGAGTESIESAAPADEGRFGPDDLRCLVVLLLARGDGDDWAHLPFRLRELLAAPQEQTPDAENGAGLCQRRRRDNPTGNRAATAATLALSVGCHGEATHTSHTYLVIDVSLGDLVQVTTQQRKLTFASTSSSAASLSLGGGGLGMGRGATTDGGFSIPAMEREAFQAHLRYVAQLQPDATMSADATKELKLATVEFADAMGRQRAALQGVFSSKCYDCPKRETQYRLAARVAALRRHVEALTFAMSNESLSQFPNFQSMVSVLHSLEYMDTEQVMLSKGRVACEISTTQELLVTEMIWEDVFDPLSPAEVAAILAALLFEEKTDVSLQDLEVPETLVQACTQAQVIAEALGTIQEQAGLPVDRREFVKECLNFGLTDVVYAWGSGVPFQDIMTLTDVYEGSIVRCVTRLDELCRDVRNASRVIGKPSLYRKMEAASQCIKRDIIFTASLYVS